MRKQISVIKESSTGRNEMFRDNYTRQIMTGKEFAEKILNREYGKYHVRNINGVLTPVSNPDNTTKNNLG